jgi:DNA-binding NarL/FixJ family response regulator
MGPSRVSDPAAARITVVVVDDSESYREAASRLVGEISGFVIVGSASSGEDAVRLAAELAPDLVLMDVRMPGMDGVEATRSIVDARPETLVVLMSATRDGGARRAETAGAAVSIDKRNLTAEILEEIRREVVRRREGG